MTPLLTGVFASQISGHLNTYTGPTSAFDALATVTVPSGGLATVTFANVPTGYKHLQIRALGKSNRAGGQDQFTMVINGDTTTNYYQHAIEGTGNASAATAFAYARNWVCLGDFADDTYNSNVFGAAICDILEYSNTNKYKTTRSISGWDSNGNGYVRYESSLWNSTSAITSLTIGVQDGTLIKEFSSFALYGVK